MRTPGAPLIVLAALTAASALGAVRAATPQLAELPNAWVDDRGQSFDLRSLEGRRVVVTMAYATCHRVCPNTMSRLLQLQHDYDQRGTRAEFLVIGYDPDNDDAAAWRQYRQARHLTRANWHFLVGTREAVEQTARQLGFEFWRYDQHVMHDSRIVYFDEHGGLVASSETETQKSAQR